MTGQILQWALNQLSLNRKVAIASVVETSGSVPGKVGASARLDRPRDCRNGWWCRFGNEGY